MGFSFFQGEDQARNMQRSILLFIILATLPCYCVGAILLGVAPDQNETVQNDLATTVVATATLQTVTGTATTPTAIPSVTTTLRATPGQFFPTNTPLRVIPTIAPTLTLAPSATTAPPTAIPTDTVAANSNPQFDVPPANMTLQQGGSEGVVYAYSDPDGDPVSVTVQSNDESVATVSQSLDNNLIVDAVGAGTTFITIYLNDGRGGLNQTTFTVTVIASNQPPVFNSSPGSVTLNIGESQTVNLDISDPDGDFISVSVSENEPSIATVSVSGNQLTVTGNGAGTTSALVTLDDGHGNLTRASFAITVNSPAAPVNPDPTLTVEPTQE